MADAIANQRRNLPLKATVETCSGGTYIVTGANTGLGFEAAKHLVALGAAKVILAVRNLAAGETAKAAIEAATGHADVAEVWALDLASYDSVKAFAKKVAVELDRIDGLIENAAVAVAEYSEAEDHLLSVTVNVFSTFLLGVLLLPKLSESAKKFGITPHLVVVSSRVGFDMEEDWKKIKDDPIKKMDEQEVIVFKSYPLTKLLESFAVRHLASLAPVSRTGVVINTVCPGLCVTDLSRNALPAFKENIAVRHTQYGRTAEDGSRTLLFGAVAGKESHGRFLDSCEIADDLVPSWVTDGEGKTSQRHVWEIIAKELEVAEPGCLKHILQE